LPKDTRPVLALALLLCQISSAVPILAEERLGATIEIAYVEPATERYRPYYEELKRRGVLEELQRFLAPLRLPRRLVVRTYECGSEAMPYEPGGPVTLCYEYVGRIVELAPPDATPTGVSRQGAITGAFVQSALHGVAHAVFDLLEIPIWGREHDAADNLAAFVMLQFGRDVAVRTVTGAVWFFEASGRTWTGSEFARATSPEGQRFYNFLCIAYGGDPVTFEALVKDSLLATPRAARCSREYGEIRYAFRRFILPKLDQAALAEVQSMQWARPEDEQPNGAEGAGQ
jgi:hypothetical protein